MSIKSTLRRSPSSVIAACSSCVVFLYIVSTVIPVLNTEEFGQCNDKIEYLLGEYKELALQKTTQQKQKYLEVNDLRNELKKTTIDLKRKERECTSEIGSLNQTVKLLQDKSKELQRLLDGAFSTMDRSSVVLTTVLQALQKAELRVEELERRLAAGSNSNTSSNSSIRMNTSG